MIDESGVYVIRNIQTSFVYVGSSCHIYVRCCEHVRLLKRQKHPCIYLQRAWNKYGENAFDFDILEVVSEADQLLTAEKHWIDYLRSAHRDFGYNMALVPGAPNRGRIFSAETRAKMSAAHKNRAPCSEETREKCRISKLGSKNPNFGKRPSEAILARLLASAKKPRSLRARENYRRAKLGAKNPNFGGWWIYKHPRDTNGHPINT